MTSTPTPAEQSEQNRSGVVDGPGLLTLDGHNLELPRVRATDGADGLGVSKLLGATGRQRALAMTWERAAENTLQQYRRIL